MGVATPDVNPLCLSTLPPPRADNKGKAGPVLQKKVCDFLKRVDIALRAPGMEG